MERILSDITELNMNIQSPSKLYHMASNRLYSCQYHVVFCTKYRRGVLTDGIEQRLKELVFLRQEDWSYSVLEIEVMADHVHLVVDVDPYVGIYCVVNHIKGFTSRKLREEYPILKRRLPCLWTQSKFISTVGSLELSAVKSYIAQQKGK